MAGISARFSDFAFVLFCYITNHLMTVPLGTSHFKSVYCYRLHVFRVTNFWKLKRFSASPFLGQCLGVEKGVVSSKIRPGIDARDQQNFMSSHAVDTAY